MAPEQDRKNIGTLPEGQRRFFLPHDHFAVQPALLPFGIPSGRRRGIRLMPVSRQRVRVESGAGRLPRSCRSATRRLYHPAGHVEWGMRVGRRAGSQSRRSTGRARPPLQPPPSSSRQGRLDSKSFCTEKPLPLAPRQIFLPRPTY
jgi:hypothetical protein